MKRIAIIAALVTVVSFSLGKYFDSKCEAGCLLAAGKEIGEKHGNRIVIGDGAIEITDDEMPEIKEPSFPKLPEIANLEAVKFSGISTDLRIHAGDALKIEAITYKSDKGWVIRADGNTLLIDVKVKGPNELFLTLPAKAFKELKIDNVSGDVNVGSKLEFAKIDINNTSGDAHFNSSPKDEFSINTVSGDVSLDSPEKVSQHIKVNTVSGDVSLTIPSGFKKLLSNSVSGDVRLKVEGPAKFSYRMHSISGDFNGLKGGEIKEGIADKRATGNLGDSKDSELEFESISGDFQLSL